jgi:asparaginyl-tRNA synthetase
MIEPEMAFYDLEDNMDLAESFIKCIIGAAINNCGNDLQILQNRLIEEESSLPKDQRSALNLLDKLHFVLNTPFERITYTDAISILLNSSYYKKKKFKYAVEWGKDLQSEHERFLVEKHFNKPVIVYNYPKDIKAFYMRVNDDGKTVAAMDILAPGIGEIIGGSQREERLDVLISRMESMNISTSELSWYLDTRRYGTVPHAGFGLGFERIVQFVSGMGNIRDVIPFPRFPRSAEF